MKTMVLPYWLGEIRPLLFTLFWDIFSMYSTMINDWYVRQFQLIIIPSTFARLPSQPTIPLQPSIGSGVQPKFWNINYYATSGDIMPGLVTYRSSYQPHHMLIPSKTMTCPASVDGSWREGEPISASQENPRQEKTTRRTVLCSDVLTAPHGRLRLCWWILSSFGLPVGLPGLCHSSRQKYLKKCGTNGA